MIIAKLYGGLGNQMFQYATAKKMASLLDAELKLDITHFDKKELPNGLPYRSYDLDIFNNIKERIATPKEIGLFKNNSGTLLERGIRRIRNTVVPHTVVYEPHFHFYAELLNKKGHLYLEGYWQSEKYFKDIGTLIRKQFQLNVDLNTEGKELLQRIESTNAICLNVRRQEFASNPHVDQFIGLDYISNAIQLMSEKIASPTFFIFSDELTWCKSNLKIDHPHLFVEERLYGEKFKDCLFFMRSCKHYIIPNSTFGWWAAWLNENQDKIVIAPENWLKDKTKKTTDIFPESWIKLS
jgi:hypothetical protein